MILLYSGYKGTCTNAYCILIAVHTYHHYSVQRLSRQECGCFWGKRIIATTTTGQEAANDDAIWQVDGYIRLLDGQSDSPVQWSRMETGGLYIASRLSVAICLHLIPRPEVKNRNQLLFGMLIAFLLIPLHVYRWADCSPGGLAPYLSCRYVNLRCS
jgi:hypothetical protein